MSTTTISPAEAPDSHAEARDEAWRLLRTAEHYCRCARLHLEVDADTVALVDLRAARDHFAAAIRAFDPVRRTIHQRVLEEGAP